MMTMGKKFDLNQSALDTVLELQKMQGEIEYQLNGLMEFQKEEMNSIIIECKSLYLQYKLEYK